MRDVAVLSSSQMKSIQGLVGSTLDQSVLSTVELQRMKDTASGEGDGDGGGEREKGGGEGLGEAARTRAPQSLQSVPNSHMVYSAPAPPSSHSPSLT